VTVISGFLVDASSRGPGMRPGVDLVADDDVEGRALAGARANAMRLKPPSSTRIGVMHGLEGVLLDRHKADLDDVGAFPGTTGAK